jgi:hypothetical protein
MSTTELNNATTTADKKVAVKKVIPKATMNYLKFALVIMKTGSTDIIKELLLEKSIDTIIDFVNEIVKNGNQDKEIVEMRKIALAPPKKSRAKPKAKTAENANQADTIVSDLVSLARNENDSESEPVPKKSRAKPKAKAAAEAPAAEAPAADADVPAADADAPADAKPKKSRAKPKAKADADATADADAPAADAKPKKSRAKPKAKAAEVVADANAVEVTPELKSDDFKPAENDANADAKPADDKPKKSRAKPKAKAAEVVAEDAAVADDC